MGTPGWMGRKGIEMSARESFVGVWDVVSFEMHLPDGKVIHPFGERPVGRVIYSAAGHMAVQLMRGDRPPFASDDLRDGDPEEIQAAFKGYVAYYGPYEVHESERKVIHHVEASLFPNWIGGELVRFYELSDDLLTLTTPPVKYGGGDTTSILVWKRRRDLASDLS